MNEARRGDHMDPRESSNIAESAYRELVQLGREMRALIEHNPALQDYKAELPQLMRPLFDICEKKISPERDSGAVTGEVAEVESEERSLLGIQNALSGVGESIERIAITSDEKRALWASMQKLIEICGVARDMESGNAQQ